MTPGAAVAFIQGITLLIRRLPRLSKVPPDVDQVEDVDFVVAVGVTEDAVQQRILLQVVPHLEHVEDVCPAVEVQVPYWSLRAQELLVWALGERARAHGPRSAVVVRAPRHGERRQACRWQARARRFTQRAVCLNAGTGREQSDAARAEGCAAGAPRLIGRAPGGQLRALGLYRLADRSRDRGVGAQRSMRHAGAPREVIRASRERRRAQGDDLRAGRREAQAADANRRLRRAPRGSAAARCHKRRIRTRTGGLVYRAERPRRRQAGAEGGLSRTQRRLIIRTPCPLARAHRLRYGAGGVLHGADRRQAYHLADSVALGAEGFGLRALGADHLADRG